ncbi:polysaccharide lyase [Niveibacterium sp. SC-1]|uniref:polysaccharide lyase n=1 Tax=Niveibacterium sp. SC-1 TaxID=3135646 RepID=UPI00311F4FDC
MPESVRRDSWARGAAWGVCLVGLLVLPAAHADCMNETHPMTELDLAAVLRGEVPLEGHYHFQNGEVREEGGLRFLRVRYPRGSIDPGGVARHDTPAGGIGFRWRLPGPGADCQVLRYRLRFAPGFDFVRGGKLPGLGGGAGNTGGHIPNGRDGFSARLMWRQGGAGELYAYLPESETWGSSIGRGRWHFEPGRWISVEERLRLNTLGQADGEVRILIDGAEVLHAEGLHFRDVATLKADLLLFETFFGGNTADWAPPADTWVDFAGVAVGAGNVPEQ